MKARLFPCYIQKYNLRLTTFLPIFNPIQTVIIFSSFSRFSAFLMAKVEMLS